MIAVIVSAGLAQLIDWRGDVEKGKKRKNGQLNVWISGDQVDLWTSDK